MLNQTSETAIRALILIAMADKEKLMTPKGIAEQLGTSPSYMAKITGALVKANLLRSQRGAAGGVTMTRDPKTVTLLAILEACQGLLIGNYCEAIGDHPEPVCAYHLAMKEAHQALVSVFSRWTLAMLLANPGPAADGPTNCKMGFFCRDGKYVCLGANGLACESAV